MTERPAVQGIVSEFPDVNTHDIRHQFMLHSMTFYRAAEASALL